MNYVPVILAFLLIAVNPASRAQELPSPAHGKIVRHEGFVSSYTEAQTIDVWLPAGYSPEKKYAVIYMHDGQNLFDVRIHGVKGRGEWCMDENIQPLIDAGRIPDCIIVGIWSTRQRRCSYFPEEAFRSLPDTAQQHIEKEFGCSVASDLYLKCLVEEVKPFIDRTYSTHSDRAHTLIAGASMGGLISLYALCAYPNVFGGAACLSTHWIGCPVYRNDAIPESFLHYLKAHLPDPATHSIYMDHGSLGYDALYAPWQKQASRILRKKGYRKKNGRVKVFTGAMHNEEAWQLRADDAIAFLFHSLLK